MTEFAFFYSAMIGVTFALMLVHFYVVEDTFSWELSNFLTAFLFGLAWPIIFVVISAILMLWCTMFVLDLFEVK